MHKRAVMQEKNQVPRAVEFFFKVSIPYISLSVSKDPRKYFEKKKKGRVGAYIFHKPVRRKCK